MRKLRKAYLVLSSHFRSMPLHAFALFVLRTLFSSEWILIYVVDLATIPDTVSSANVVKGTRADLVAARASATNPVPWEWLCDVYDGVTEFFMYRDSATIGHISWLYFQDDPNRILRLGPADCEVKFCLTLPAYRGKGLYPAALRTIQGYLRARGYNRCFVCVRDDNVASVRGITKAGFRLIRRTRVRKMLGVQVSSRYDARSPETTIRS